MPSEIIRTGRGERRLHQQSKCIDMTINYNPPAAKKFNYPDTIIVDIQEHLTQEQEDPSKNHDPCIKIILIYYNTPYGTHLSYHTTTHQYYIHTRDMDNKLTFSANWCGTYGRTPTDKKGRSPPTPEGIHKATLCHHAVHYQRMMDTPAISVGKIWHPDQEIKKMMVMTTNLMNIVQYYARRRLNNPPDILFTLTHLDV